MTTRRLTGRALEKVWGTTVTEPWYPASPVKTGEVWFTAPEEPRLLVKFLFTSEKLSVQVHPGDIGGEPGKTEMWHVLRAGPRAGIALGFNRTLTGSEARAAAISGEIESMLHWYAPAPGDTFFVPAGTVHAIGEDLALVEIQQHSDTTYRLYDYGRPRDLHLDQGLAVAQLGPHPGPVAAQPLRNGRQLLVECSYFRTESLVVSSDRPHRAGETPEMLVCVEGTGSFNGDGFAPGQVWLLTAHAETTIRPQGAVRLLRTFVPDSHGR
ncbi:MAG: class I mannose-6-phosphate isomerase [Bryobacteraceae bacterium]